MTGRLWALEITHRELPYPDANPDVMEVVHFRPIGDPKRSPNDGRCQCKTCREGKPFVRLQKLVDHRKAKAAPLKGDPWDARACGIRDRIAYWKYIRVALRAGVSPLSAQQWLLLAGGITKPRYLKGGQTDEMQRRVTRKELTRRALYADLVNLGFHWGELRKDGSVGPVRPKEPPIDEDHMLTWRTCKKCRELLPHYMFYKKLSRRRSTCRWCDVEARINRRKAAGEILKHLVAGGEVLSA
jgi:hypothetical protein